MWWVEGKSFGDDELEMIRELDGSWKEKEKAKEYERDSNKISLSCFKLIKLFNQLFVK